MENVQREKQGSIQVPRIIVDLSQATPYADEIMGSLKQWKQTPGYNGGLHARMEAERLIEKGKQPLERFVNQLAPALMPRDYHVRTHPDYPYVTEIFSSSGPVILIQYGEKGFESLFRKVNNILGLDEKLLEEMHRTGKQTNLYNLLQKGEQYMIGDLYRMRVVGEDISALRKAQEVIEQKADVLPETVSDYISKPRKNGYQTRGFCARNPEDGKVIEVQLRTLGMHLAANSEAQKNYHINIS